MDRKDAAMRLPEGLINITVTPFGATGSVRHADLEDGIDRALRAGYDGILIGGTYGEFATMTADERIELFELAARRVSRKVPLLLCAAAADTPTARRLAKVAHDVGGFPMLTPPYVSEVTKAQVEAFFRDIATTCSDRVIIYNAPGVGATLSVEQIVDIAAIPGVVGLKQGELAPAVVDRLVGHLGGRIRLIAASDLSISGPVGTGFDGLSSTNSCAFPELIAEIYHAFRQGNGVRGRELNQSWFAYREFARAHGQPQTVKAAMEMRGWRGGHVRAPLLDLGDEALRALRPIVDAIVARKAAPTLAGAARVPNTVS